MLKLIGKKQYIWLGTGLFGLCILAIALLLYQADGSAGLYRVFIKVGIVGGIVIGLAGGLLFILDSFMVYEKNNILSIKVYLIEALVVAVTVILIGALGLQLKAHWRGQKASEGQWSIGIYFSSSNEPLDFSGESVSNPVLTAANVKDIKATFVADPFLVQHQDEFFMFFEVLNADTNQGDIGMARSLDGVVWKYDKIVLDERFHLAYPYIFEWEGSYYMIPASESRSIRLYRAENFPYKWSLVKTLLDGKRYNDSSILFYNNMWWLFSETGSANALVLRLYFANSPTGKWVEHPLSPIVKDNDIARPGGRIVKFGNRIIRYAQDCDPYYGNQVWAIEITTLTTTSYAERKALSKPILKGYESWNTRGMHNLAPIRHKNGTWISSVDGN